MYDRVFARHAPSIVHDINDVDLDGADARPTSRVRMLVRLQNQIT